MYFVSSNDDVCKKLYPAGQREGGEEVRGGNKVDLVCEAVRAGLKEAGEEKYLLSVITSYVRMSEPQLETVLDMIEKLKG